MGDGPNQSRLSARHIKQACDASLRRLQTDYIDLYQMHHVDRQTPWEEIWQAMEQLYREGKVLYVGSSNFAGWHLAQAQEMAKHRNFLGLVSEQSLYNLNDRMIELEVIPACEAYGIGVIPWSPVARGLLAGALKPATGGRRADEDLRKNVEKYRPRLEAYEQLCRELGEEPAHVALAWLLHQPAVTSPIIGPTHIGPTERDHAQFGIDALQRCLEKIRYHLPRTRRPGPGSLCLVRATFAESAFFSCRFLGAFQAISPTLIRIPFFSFLIPVLFLPNPGSRSTCHLSEKKNVSFPRIKWKHDMAAS